MQTGALIVAAGKSSRMGDFKPMLQLGSISIAQRVINNFRQAGISKVVVVTGCLLYTSRKPPNWRTAYPSVQIHEVPEAFCL